MPPRTDVRASASSRAASAPSGASSAACSSMKPSSAVWTPPRNPSPSQPVFTATAARLASGHRRARRRSSSLDCRHGRGHAPRASATSSERASARSPSSSSRPKDEAGEAQLWQRDQRARAVPPDVRLGDVRRRRHHPRPHRRASPAGSPRDLAAADGAPDLRRPHPRGARRHPAAARATPASATCWRCAATRPAAPGTPWDADRGRPRRTPRSWSSSSGPAREAVQRRRRRIPGGPPGAPSPSTTTRRAGGQARRRRRVRRHPDGASGLGLLRAGRAGAGRAASTSRSCPGIMPILNLNSIRRHGRADPAASARRDRWLGSCPLRATRPRSAPRASGSPPSCATSCSPAARPGCTSTR